MCSTNVKQLILKTFIQAQLFQQLIPKQNTVFTNAVRSLFVTLIHLYIFKLINCYIYIYKYNNLISAIIHSQHFYTYNVCTRNNPPPFTNTLITAKY